MDLIWTNRVDGDDFVLAADVNSLAAAIITDEASTAANSASITELNTKVVEKTSYGVYTGLGVTQQTVANMTVSIATGTIYMADGTRFTPTANTALSVTAADATNPRIDIVYVNSSGVISYLAGTAAASPSVPSVPVGGQKLAEISVAANATAIANVAIVDGRRLYWNEPYITPTLINSWANFNATYSSAKYYKDIFNTVQLSGLVKGGANNSSAFTLPVGYRPLKTHSFASGYVGNLCEITVDTSGSVKIAYTSTPVYVSLENVRFRV